MHLSWYKNSMPKVKEAKEELPRIKREIEKISGVKGILIFGSYIENENNPNYPLRDLDIIAITNFDSGDLLSIPNKNSSYFHMPKESLEENGFNPKAVLFTKEFTKISDLNIDHWAISKNKNLLHWGPMNEDKAEWDNIKKEAEEYAKQQTGISREKLGSNEHKIKWKTEHDYYIDMYLKDIPVGWYQSNCKLKDIIAVAKKI